MILGEQGGVPDEESGPRPSVNQENGTKDPEDRDGLSDGSLRMEETKTCLFVCLSLLNFHSVVLQVMDPPAAHRKPVGFILPHPDVRTPESHPDKTHDIIFIELNMLIDY